jgi:hypothetical protein
MISTASGWSTGLRIRVTFKQFETLLLLFALAGSILFAAQAYRFLPVSGENVYPESAAVLTAKRWADGLPLYSDYRQSPYLMTAFPPAWYLMMGSFAKLGHLDMDQLTFYGRFFSLACVIGTALLAFLWNRREGLEAKSTVIAPLFFLCLPILSPWNVTARPDFPGLLLSFFAAYWITSRSGWAQVAFAAVAAAIALLFRHNAVAAPIAIVLWLVFARQWKRAAVFSSICGATIAVGMAPFLIQNKSLVFLNLSSAKFGHFAITYLRDIVSRSLSLGGSGFILVLFALGVFGYLAAFTKSSASARLLRFYLPVSLFFAALGSSTAGGAINHYFEASLILAVLIPVGLSQLKQDWNETSGMATFSFIFVLAILLPGLDGIRSKALHDRPEDLRAILPLVKSEPTFTDISFLAARSYQPQLVDLPSLINTERIGGWASWSSKGLVDDLVQRKYRMVVLARQIEIAYVPDGYYPRTPNMDVQIQKAIAENYTLCFEMNDVYVYGTGVYVYEPNDGIGSDSSRCRAQGHHLSTTSALGKNVVELE